MQLTEIVVLKPSFRFEGMRKVLLGLGSSQERCMEVLEAAYAELDNQKQSEAHDSRAIGQMAQVSQEKSHLKLSLSLHEDEIFGHDSVFEKGGNSPRELLDKYNKGSFMIKQHEETLAYWKRAEDEMTALSCLARDVLGASATSVNVERIFSAAGNTTQNYHRGRLTARNIVKSVSSKVLMSQGVLVDESRGHHRLKRKVSHVQVKNDENA